MTSFEPEAEPSFIFSGRRKFHPELDLSPAAAFPGAASRRGRRAAARSRGAAAPAAAAAPQPVGSRAAQEPQHGMLRQCHQNQAATRHARHDAFRYTGSGHDEGDKQS